MKKEITTKEVLAEGAKKEKINNQTLPQDGEMEKAKEITGKGNGAAGMELKFIDINSIIIPEHRFRINNGENSALESSMQSNGMQEPITVYETKKGIVLLDGFSRLEVLKKMGVTKTLCLVRKISSDAEAAHLAFVINNERKTVSPIEEARYYEFMIVKYGYTLRDLQLLNCGSPASITNKRKLLNLPDNVQEKIHRGILTAAHANALSKLSTKEEQELMTKRIVGGNMTVKTTERQIDCYLAKIDQSKEDKAKKSFIPDDDLPRVYFKPSSDMCEQPDNTVPLIVTNTLGFDHDQNIYRSFKDHLANIESFAKEVVRVVSPGGIIVLLTDYVKRTERGVSVIKLMGPIYQNSLQKHGALLTDMIIWVVPSSLSKRNIRPNTADQPHTSYRIYNNCLQIYIYRVKGVREKLSEEIISQSKLTEEQRTAWTGENGLWGIGMEEMFNRLIRIYSHVGDTVLAPFLGDGTMLKVAKELGRVGIGYEENIKNKPAIMETLGLIPEEAAVKSSNLMAAYVKQTRHPEVDITRLFDDAPAEGTKEDDLGKSSKPEPEFFGRMTQLESNEYEEVAEEETVS